MVKFKCFLKRRDLCRYMDNAFFFVKSEMIIFVIADFHCLEGISVVGMFQSQHQGAFSSLIGVVLESHLEGNFYRNASGIRKEAVVQVTRKKFLELIRKFFYRLMGETAEHHMAETVSLFFDGSGQFRVFVAVDHTPPGRNRIDQFLVFGVEMHAFCIQDLVRLFHCFHLFIRIPYHLIFTSS